ncbi:MAG: ATP-binding protein [Verrucomicrobiia bacterium]
MAEHIAEQKSVLVVDDNDVYRDELVAQLRDPVTDVIGVRTAVEAEQLFRADPQRFQFAVIDQVLDNNQMGGIALTHKLASLSRDLFVLVFTNVPSDNAEVVARFRYEALSAGAFRYIERGSPHKDKILVKAFVDEMMQLSILREWIGRYYADRENVPSLLTQLSIGVDIIDRSHKLWFMNDAMRRITGLTTPGLPQSPCSNWHGIKFWPCLTCLVHASFKSGQPDERLFLSLLPFREKDKLFYLRVWAQPITDNQGKVVIAADGRPLAVMESVQDLTDSAQLSAMPLDRRLDLIAGALRDRPSDNSYIPKRLFERVRIMFRDGATDNFIVMAASGYGSPQASESRLIPPRDYLQDAEDNMRRTKYGYFFPLSRDRSLQPGAPSDNFIYWPIVEGDRTIALIEVSGSDCNSDIVGVIRPYAREVLNALEDSRKAGERLVAEVESEVGKIDLDLQKVGTPFNALKFLVRKGVHLTGSCSGHIRYVEGDNAVLLKLDDAQPESYEAAAPESYSLKHIASWSVRTILSAQEHIQNTEEHSKEIYSVRDALSPEARRPLDTIKAICLQPLIIQSRCIGSLCLQATAPQHFKDQKRRQVAREIARRAAFALHDFLVERRTAEQVEQAQIETFALILHNISTPTVTMRFALTNLVNRLNELGVFDADVAEGIAAVEQQNEIVSGVRAQFLNLRKPYRSRMETVVLPEYLRERIAALLRHQPELDVKFKEDSGLAQLKIDVTAIELVLSVLMQNAVDALQHQKDKKHILIHLRLIEAQERYHANFSGPGLCIDVEDGGPGVPADMVDSLFETIQSSKAKGLGFGLKSSRRVARAARGDVYYHKEFQDGAKFTLVLPYESV